jgi:hypothetical protein
MFDTFDEGTLGPGFPKAMGILLAVIALVWWLFPPGGRTKSIIGKEFVAASQSAGPEDLEGTNLSTDNPLRGSDALAWFRISVYADLRADSVAARPPRGMMWDWAKHGNAGWLEKGDRVRILAERILINSHPYGDERKSEQVVRIEHLNARAFGAKQFWVLKELLIASPSSAPSSK